LSPLDLDRVVDRDAARAALSVFRVAKHRDDLDEVGAMQCAIHTYQVAREREGREREAAERRAAWRPAVEHRTRVRLTLRQVAVIRGALLALFLSVAGTMAAAEPEPTTFRSMFYGLPGALPEPADVTLEPSEPGSRCQHRCRMSLLEHAAAIYLPGGLSDGLTTEYFLTHGGNEMNPLLRERWVRVPVKLLVEPLAAAAGERWLERHRRRTLALLFRYAMWATRLYASISNIRYGNRLRREAGL
jgi:hypothetical protein